ncbi:hypothetical protein TeGR_g13836 [Tetraparma gracilis]|uniref:Uncharacterized protein n=1 Tax=Tetraparma gracilis TaxID=2962635 RepID=A0ABQ6MVR6_9STRA|nr:hypothetical protein TeGR_g13836 [Tetraparma gracilis]
MPPAFAPSRTFALEAGGGRGKEKVKVVKEHKAWMDRPKAPKGKLTEMRKVVSGLSKDNFEKVYEFEDLLVNNVGQNLYQKTVKKIRAAATRSGVTLKADFAKDPACLSDRRSKQGAFVQAKLEAAKEAAAEAAAAAEEEAAKAAEAEAAPVAEAAAEEVAEEKEPALVA